MILIRSERVNDLHESNVRGSLVVHAKGNVCNGQR